MEKTNNRFLVGVSLLIAITVVLQTLSVVLIKIAGFGFNLVLIPIIIACVLFGIKGGTIVGAAFGLTAFLHCVLGWDAGGALFFAENWYLTLLATFGRGAVVGLSASLVFGFTSRLFANNRTVPSIITSVLTPIINTGLFVLIAYFLFFGLIESWAISEEAENVFKYLIGIVSLNFAFEIVSTTILCSPIVMALKKSISAE